MPCVAASCMRAQGKAVICGPSVRAKAQAVLIQKTCLCVRLTPRRLHALAFANALSLPSQNDMPVRAHGEVGSSAVSDRNECSPSRGACERVRCRPVYSCGSALSGAAQSCAAVDTACMQRMEVYVAWRSWRSMALPYSAVAAWSEWTCVDACSCHCLRKKMWGTQPAVRFMACLAQ